MPSLGSVNGRTSAYGIGGDTGRFHTQSPGKRRGVAVALPAIPPAAPTFLLKLDKGKSVLEFRNGSVIFSQGEPADSVFYVQAGKVKETVVSQDGKQAVLAIVGAGQFFGEASLVAGHTLRMCSAISMGRATVLRFPKEMVVRLIHEDVEFADHFVSHLLARTVRVEEDLIDQFFHTTEKRLARILLVLANLARENESQTVIPRVSQDTLAQMVGASRSRVSSYMNKFRKLGVIDYDGEGLRVNGTFLRTVLRS